MVHKHYFIGIDGKKIDDDDVVYQDITSLEVELDVELANMFRIRIGNLEAYLDDKRFMIWKSVTIWAGFEESGTEELISGPITHVRPYFDPERSQCALEIWGMDWSVIMDREERNKAWPGKKDSDIVKDILIGKKGEKKYGLTAKIDDTKIVHDEKVSTTIQCETDIQFLKRLATRNGFECYVEGKVLYFQKPRVDDTPQKPVLVVDPEGKTNVDHFSFELNAFEPTNVAMFQMDRINGEILDVSVETDEQKLLGRNDAKSLLPTGISPGKIYIRKNIAMGRPEMTALCKSLYHPSQFFVTGEGEIDSHQYKHVLKPRKTVTIRGIGKTYSGVYYITHVTHTFTNTPEYIQFIRVKRNAINPTGREDFTDSS